MITTKEAVALAKAGKPLPLREGQPPMNPQPINMSLKRAAALLALRSTVVVTLEPGDATRYDLVLTPLPWVGNYSDEDQGAGLLVTRFRGGDAVACGVVLLNREYHNNIPALACDNLWTEVLFYWWFTLLAKEMRFIG